MDWITNPEIWISLLTLTVLEVILGIDNIVFNSIKPIGSPKISRPASMLASAYLLTLGFTRNTDETGACWA